MLGCTFDDGVNEYNDKCLAGEMMLGIDDCNLLRKNGILLNKTDDLNIVPFYLMP